MNLKKRLTDKQKQNNTTWESIERDYVQSWIIAAIAQHPKLSQSLVFKGGTAIKKLWHAYRFSEDLDYTEIVPSNNGELLGNLDEALNVAKTWLESYGNFVFELTQYTEKKEHPFNQAAFTISIQMPWQRKPLTRVKLEISRDEELLFEPIEKEIDHDYGEDLSDHKIPTYALEEIICEKFRGVLQNQEKLIKKGWTRSRVRDYYDLWKLLSNYKNKINVAKIRKAFPQKCLAKEISFKNPDQFFDEKYLEYVKKDWQEYLESLVDHLPEFNVVILKLRRYAHELFC